MEVKIGGVSVDMDPWELLSKMRSDLIEHGASKDVKKFGATLDKMRSVLDAIKAERGEPVATDGRAI